MTVTSLPTLFAKTRCTAGRSLLAMWLLAGFPVLAQDRDCSAIPPVIPISGAQLTDAAGWTNRAYHASIQTQDLDGDGQEELLARWTDGLHIWSWTGSLWREGPLNPLLKDDKTLSQIGHQASLQVARLDPANKRSAVIARRSDGIHVYQLNAAGQEWQELGASVTGRPFADNDPTGTDWSQPQYYLSIQLADLDKDGRAELVGRGRQGIEVYRWDAAGQRWQRVTSSGPLPDGTGFEQERYNYFLSLVDLDKDGAAELLVRGETGVQVYRWMGNGWQQRTASGPFCDTCGLGISSRYKTVRTFVDDRGQVWLYGLTAGSAGPSSATLSVYRWTGSAWAQASRFGLPGTGWERDSQLQSVRAANLEGDPLPEFVARAADGLHTFRMDGTPLASLTTALTDAQGWSRSEHFGTLQTAKLRVQRGGQSVMKTVVLGRGRYGVEAYTLNSTWAAASSDDFPTWTDPNQLAAFRAISQSVRGVDNIRNLYPQYYLDAASWVDAQTNVRNMKGKRPSGVPSSLTDTGFEEVRSQVETELAYVVAVKSWFANNNEVMNYVYSQSSGLLSNVAAGVSLDDGSQSPASVALHWVEFVMDLIGNIAGGLNRGQVQAVLAVLHQTIDAAIGLTTPTDPTHDLQVEVFRLGNQFIDQQNKFTDASACHEMQYLSDWSLLKTLGQPTSEKIYTWGEVSSGTEVAAVKDAGSRGLETWLYKTLLPITWKVWACDPQDIQWLFGGCSADTNRYPFEFNCRFSFYSADRADRTAYLVLNKGGWPYPSFDALRRITSPVDKGGIDSIWYPMILGGNLGWEPATTEWRLSLDYQRAHPSSTGLQSVDEPGRSSGACHGGGSLTGHSALDNLNSTAATAATTPSLKQQVVAAQAIPERVTATQARALAASVRMTRQLVRSSVQDRDLRDSLDAPLQLALQALRKVTNPAALPQDVPQSSEAELTMPAHNLSRMLEMFVRRAQVNARAIGADSAARLAAQGYELLDQAQGRNQPQAAAVKLQN